MTLPSSKPKTTATEITLHKKSDCQEAFNKLGKVNYCTDNFTDYQLPSLHNSNDFLIDSFTDQRNKKIKI